MPHDNSDTFNAFFFINDLIEEMGLQNENPAKLAQLKNSMLDALMGLLMQTARDNLEPEVIDVVMEEMKDVEDPILIVQELIQRSAEVQLAMLDALQLFKENTLEAYNQLKV